MNPGLERVRTGVAGLDTVLDGGLFQDSLTIVQGQPGAGKTILGNQMCFSHARGGGRAVYVTLLAENHSRMLQHLCGMDFFDQALIPGGVFYASAFQTLEADGLRGLLRLLWDEMRRHEATLLVLDGLVTVELQAVGEMAFKKFVHELQAQAVLAGCSMVLLTSAGEGFPPSAEHTMVDAVIEMRSRLYGWRAERDMEVLKRRGAGFLRGRHAFRITDAGVEVFPRFEALLSPPGGVEKDVPFSTARIPSGLPALDAMLHGGIPLGSTTLLTGPSGGGKTTLALQFLGECGAGEPGLLLTTSESPSSIMAKAAAMGLPAHGLMQAGHVGTLWSPGVAGILDEVAGRLLAEVERRGARRLVLDSILGLVRLAPDPERVAHILAALSLGMRARGVTTLLTAEQNGPDPLLPGVPDLLGIPENLLSMHLLDGPGGLVRTLQVRKARNTAIDSRAHTFALGAEGLRVAPPDATGTAGH